VDVADAVGGFGWTEFEVPGDFVEGADVFVDVDDPAVQVGVGAVEADEFAPPMRERPRFCG
jgi:hypothetical protein